MQQQDFFDGLRACCGSSYFFALQQAEPNQNLAGFAFFLFRRSGSYSTVVTYFKALAEFSRFASTHNKTLSGIMAEIKNGDSVYSVLDDFVTFLSARAGARTVRTYFVAIKKFLSFNHIALDQQLIKNIVLPRQQDFADEVPDDNIIKNIVLHSPPAVSALIRFMCDSGFELVDALQLRVGDIYENETPARVVTTRQKTGKQLEAFIGAKTLDAIKKLIADNNRGPGDYIFVRNFSTNMLSSVRAKYNIAVARAGYGQIIENENSQYAINEKIAGHKYGRYHLKVYKKRWFTKAIIAGVPEYAAQAMLGRKQYLDTYFKLPLQTRREFAEKILASVTIDF